MITIVGIDPGLARGGIAVVKGTVNGRKLKLAASHFIKTKSSESLTERLAYISDLVRSVCLDHQPTCVVVEKIFSGMGLCHARGAILAAIASCNVGRVEEVQCQKLKLAVTGDRNASKYEVAKTVRDALEIEESVKLPLDVTDACSMALGYWALFKESQS